MSAVGWYPTPQAMDATGSAAFTNGGGNTKQWGGVNSLAGMASTGKFPSSPQGIPASHSHSPGSDWARKMTATYGRKFGAYWLSSDPPDSWVRTLLGTSIWGSMTCYLTWKKSVTPAGRLLFRLVPQAPRTVGIASGFWPTPDTPSGGRTMPRGTTSTGKTPDGRKVTVGLENAARMWPTPRVVSAARGPNATGGPNLGEAVRMYGTPRAIYGEHAGMTDESHLTGQAGATGNLKLNSAWVSRMMGYPDDWLTLDGEATR